MGTDPDAAVEAALIAGRRPIRVLGYDAPYARLVAAGFQPIRLVAPRLSATPRADAIMGAAEMGPRGRRLLEALVAPKRPEVPVLITQTDAEQPQIFAALRELGRLGEAVPDHVHFLDLLHTDRAITRSYNAARLNQLGAWLVQMGGVRPTPEAIERAQSDYRTFAGRLNHLCGTDRLNAIAAAATLPAAEWDVPERGAAAAGVAVYLTGSAHEGDEVYRAMEDMGARIVGENHAWGPRFLDGETIPARIESPETSAARTAADVARLQPELVLHVSLDGDEAAPWDVAAIRRALPAGVRFEALRCPSLPDEATVDCLRAAIVGSVPAATGPTPVKASGQRPASPRPARSRKSLTSTADANTYQREWFAGVREAVAGGAPFAVVNANAPQEILRALDIPFVVNQWWASIVAAKQQSRRYQGLLRTHDYPGDVEAYSAQGLAAAFDDDAGNAPWGGLPKPDFVHAVASSDPTAKLFEEWAAQTGADLFIYERTIDPRPDLFSDWWQRLPAHWDSVLEDERVDLMLDEIRTVIARLGARTGRPFDAERFAAVMDLVNEQEGYYRKTRDLIARTVPAPIGVVDQMPATMVPQWHRGTVWARDAAKALYEEVKARAEAGQGVCAEERVRLMWVGRGLWSEMAFYQKWEDSHGAVFVWSMYLSLAADGYIRDLSGGRDPLRALASRVICMGDELRMPTWAGPWHVHEARTHQVDGAVALADADPFVVRALRAAGIPVLELAADNFNRESEDGAAIDAAITSFIEGPAGARAEARRERA